MNLHHIYTQSLQKVKGVVKLFSVLKSASPFIFLMACVLTLISGIIPLLVALVTKQIFDRLATVGDAVSFSVYAISLLVLLFVLLQTVAEVLESANSLVSGDLNRNLDVFINETLYGRVASLQGLRYFEDPSFYDKINMADRGINQGLGGLVDFTTSLIRDISTLVSFSITLLFLNPLLVLFIYGVTIPLTMINAKNSSERLGVAFRVTPKQRRRGYYRYLLTDRLAVKEIQTFGLSEEILKRLMSLIRSINTDQRTQEVKEVRRELMIKTFLAAISGVSFATIIWLAAAGSISIGDVTLYSAAILSVQGALSSFSNSLIGLDESILFFKEYERLESLPLQLIVPKKSREVPQLIKEIEFRNVGFRYNDQSPFILRGLNFTIQVNQSTALIGQNGAGKTTLIKLLLRLYDPVEGAILWDGTDIRDFNISDYRKRLGVVFQDFNKYDLTVQENIGFGSVSSKTNYAGVVAAAEEIGIHSMIESLPNGYSTILSRQFLGEQGIEGVDLSGGQWQRVAIARLLYRKSDILVLDEPTASLDSESEQALLKRLLNETKIKGRACLLISHRLSTIEKVEKVAILNAGTIVEMEAKDYLNTMVKLNS